MDLEDVQKAIDERWGSSEYSDEFNARPDAQRDAHHAVLHVTKALGKVAGELDDLDHAKHGDSRATLAARVGRLEKALADIVICAMRIGSRWPGRRIDLAEAVDRRIEEKFPKPTTAFVPASLTWRVLAEVSWERERQQKNWGRRELAHALAVEAKLSDYGLAGDAVCAKHDAFDGDKGDWVRILVAEVVRFTRAAASKDRLTARKFAVRIAAVATAIVESIDSGADGAQ